MAEERVAYRPSNGSEGEWFASKFCDQCEAERIYRDGEGDSCPIMGKSMAFDVEHPQYPAEWREDGPLGPRCTAFRPEGTASPDRVAADLARYEAAMAAMRNATSPHPGTEG